VLVVQEVFGVHEHIKDICRRLAKAGYYAIARELNARQGNPAKISDIQELVQKIVMKVPTDQVMSDLDAAAAYATASGKVDATKLAATGFCWGGWATWMYSAHNPNLKAAVAWYGSDRKPTELTPKKPLDIASDVKCPVLALYGGVAAFRKRRSRSVKLRVRRPASAIAISPREVCSDLVAIPCRCGHPKTRNLERYNVQPRRHRSLEPGQHLRPAKRSPRR
jgi:dienelactone hydrolase